MSDIIKRPLRKKENVLGKKATLSVSVVTYNPAIPELCQTLKSLNQAILYAEQYGKLAVVEFFLIDNGLGASWRHSLTLLINELFQEKLFRLTEVLSGHGNIGYGQGHNLAAARATSDFHLVLNPDVILDKDAIFEALRFMSDHPDTGLLAPYVVDHEGEQQFLCKQYPSIFDLFLRGFGPSWLRKFFAARLEQYEMRSFCGPQHIKKDIPLISGCFMFIRKKYWDKVEGFSRKYFMYFEDYDLSLRLGKISRLAYVPAVRIQHFGGNTANKGWRHVFLFCRSALTFFQEHGWKLW